MEKIQQALEKARRQRESSSPPRPPGEGIAARGEMAAGEKVSQRPGTPVTKVHPVDQEVLKARRLVARFADIETSDAFRMLRTQVIQRMADAHASTLAITSPRAGAGKSVIAANLATTLSQFAHYNVLLVDLDLRSPGVHRVFGLNPKTGLADYLLRDVPLSDCLINPGMERITVLPALAQAELSSELLSSARMASLAAELKGRYPDRLVLYDLPPLLVTDDAMVVLKFIDACLLVVEEGATSKGDIERSLELLDGMTLIGTVLNKARVLRDSYGYRYGRV